MKTGKFFVLLLALALLLPVAWSARATEVCDLHKNPVCFGIDWQTTTVADVAGVDVRVRDRSGATALMFAVRWNKDAAVISALLDAGAYVGARNEKLDTAVKMVRRWNENPEITRILSDALAKAEQAAETCDIWRNAVCFGVDWKSATVADMAGVDVRARDEDGLTALMFAAWWNSNPAVIRAMLNAGADLKARDESMRSTALMWAASRSANPDIIRTLLEAGADIEAQGSFGTPLMRAAAWNANPEIIRVLLEAGADVKTRDLGKNTALTWAAGN